MRHEEQYDYIETEYTDIETDVKTGKQKVIRRGKNKICIGFKELLADFAVGNEFAGFRYFELDAGSTEWDAELPEPTGDERTLTAPIPESRRQITTDTYRYIDENGNTVQRSNRVEFRFEYYEGELIGKEIRGMAFWGGTLATGQSCSGKMINLKRHAKYAKKADKRLTRIIVFIF